MSQVPRLVIPGNWEKYLTFADEKLLFVQRQHWFNAFLPVGIASFTGLILLGLILVTFFFFHFPLDILISVLCTMSIVVTIIVLKLLIDWYFHIYMVTTRKILEICYIPLSGQLMNDIILDQVRCTEIDLQQRGFIAQLLDLSTIVITFDRPTHTEDFTLENVQYGKEISTVLNQELIDIQRTLSPLATRWDKNQRSGGKLRFWEDLYSGE